MTAPLPPDEAERLSALLALGVLDTSAEAEYDDLARLAASVCGTPVALVSLVDGERQWFKARVGLGVSQTHRDVSFCAHAILQDDVFEVPDARADARFAGNPLVADAPGIRFYAGAPLTTPEGHNIGTLCVIDRRPHDLSPEQKAALRVLARQVVAQFVLRRQVGRLEQEVAERERAEARLRESEDRFRAFMNNSPAVAFMKDESGRYVYVNEPMARQFERPAPEWPGKSDFEMWPAEAAEKFRDADLAVMAGGVPVRLVETTPDAGGNLTDWQVHKFPFQGAGGERYLAGLAIDVTAERRAGEALRESEARFRAVVDGLSEGVVVLDRDSRRVLRANPAFAELLGYPEGELTGLTQYDFVAHDADDIDAHMDLVEGRGRHDLGFRRYRRKGGSLVDVTVSGSLLHFDGKPALCLAVRDVGGQKRAEDALKASEAKFRATIDRLGEGVYTVEAATGRFLDANAAVLEMLGYTADEFRALTPLDLVAGETAEEFAASVEVVRRELAETGKCDVGRKPLRRKDGTTLLAELRVTTVPGAAGAPGLHAVIARDVTRQAGSEARLAAYRAELEGANARLQALATTDGLTGVCNRAAFDERLAREYERAAGAGRPLSVVILDVDHFKQFNDQFGHPAGDDALREVAAALRGQARGGDTVARYGGEEFALILPGADSSGAMAVAERCRAAVAGAAWDRRPVTVSVGVATLGDATPDASALVREADAALYRSKQAGRNRVNHGSGVMAQWATARGREQ